MLTQQRNRMEKKAKEMEKTLKLIGSKLRDNQKFLSFTKEDLLNVDLSHLYAKQNPEDNPNTPEYFRKNLTEGQKIYHYEMDEVQKAQWAMENGEKLRQHYDQEALKRKEAEAKGLEYKTKQYPFDELVIPKKESNIINFEEHRPKR